jgi:hypothetical protein
MMRLSDELTDGAIGVGTRYATEFVKAPSMVMEYVRYERPTTCSMVGQPMALTAGGGGQVEPTPLGAHLVMRMELEPRGPAPAGRQSLAPTREVLRSVTPLVDGRRGADLYDLQLLLLCPPRRQPTAWGRNRGKTYPLSAAPAYPDIPKLNCDLTPGR